MRLIDADALLVALKRKEPISDSLRFMWAECLQEVRLAPTIEERKTGRWIDTVIPSDNGGLLAQVCDQCNTFFPLAYTGGDHRYCPNCGAAMTEEGAQE